MGARESIAQFAPGPGGHGKTGGSSIPPFIVPDIIPTLFCLLSRGHCESTENARAQIEAEMQKVPSEKASEIRGEMDLMVRVAAQAAPAPSSGNKDTSDRDCRGELAQSCCI